MRHRRTIILGLALSVAMVMSAALAGTVPETLVQGGRANQFSGDGNSTYLTWAANTTERPRHYDALTRLLAGGASSKMNAPGTEGFAGDINGDTTEAVYQQTDGPVSDVYLYDLSAEGGTYVDVVNTDLWEWAPSVSDGYILFGRNKFTRSSSPWKIVLYDRNTDTTKVLDSVTFACRCIYPGQVSDDYATWTRCSRSGCQAWYYDIVADEIARVPNPSDRLQYYPAVSEDTGDLYFVASGRGCGVNVKIMRWNPVAGGDAAVVSTQPAGYDVYAALRVFDDMGGHQDVYVDRQVCGGNYYADIYVVNDADSAFDSVVAGRSVTRTSPRRLAAPGAMPRG